jgi:hypothetical protein
MDLRPSTPYAPFLFIIHLLHRHAAICTSSDVSCFRQAAVSNTTCRNIWSTISNLLILRPPPSKSSCRHPYLIWRLLFSSSRSIKYDMPKYLIHRKRPSNSSSCTFYTFYTVMPSFVPCHAAEFFFRHSAISTHRASLTSSCVSLFTVRLSLYRASLSSSCNMLFTVQHALIVLKLSLLHPTLSSSWGTWT